MRIFANHAHIIPAEFRENCGIDGLREVMADCGIEKAVCFAPLPYQMVNCQNRDSCRFLYEQMEGDPALLARALENLIRNSIRHNPGGCAITVAVVRGAGGCRFTGKRQKGTQRVSCVPAATAAMMASVCSGVSVIPSPPLSGPAGA